MLKVIAIILVALIIGVLIIKKGGCGCGGMKK